MTRRVAAVFLAGSLLFGALAFLGPAAVAENPPDAIYTGIASGVGVNVLVDTAALGGAFYVANASSPFTEATLGSGPDAKAVGSVLYDYNAATAVYALGSGQSQAQCADETQQQCGPAFPEIPNTAESWFPPGGSQTAGEWKGLDWKGPPPEVNEAPKSLPPARVEETPGPFAAHGAYATVSTDAVSATTDARVASFEVPDPSDSASTVLSVGAQRVLSSSRVSGAGMLSDSVTDVSDISVAGGVLKIHGVHSESHAQAGAKSNHATTVFRIVGAEVAGVPVTIGSDGIHVADQQDPGVLGLLADARKTVDGALSGAGLSVSIMESNTSEEGGGMSHSPGLVIRIQPPPPAGVPAETIVITIGMTDASGSFEILPPLPEPTILPTITRTKPPTVIVETIPGVPGTPAIVITPPPTTVAGRRTARRSSLPPVLALFGLWQVSGIGWVVTAAWRRNSGGQRWT